jgi:hypothetical protein
MIARLLAVATDPGLKSGDILETLPVSIESVDIMMDIRGAISEICHKAVNPRLKRAQTSTQP